MENISTEIISQEIILPFPVVNILFNHSDELQESFDNIETRSKPCTDDFIESLEEATIIQSDIDEKLSCAICQETFKLNETVIELPCKTGPHYFHINSSECGGIIPWLKRNNTCPVCRTEFPHKTEIVEQNVSNSPQSRHISINDLQNRIQNRIQNFIEQQFENDIQIAIQQSFQ